MLFKIIKPSRQKQLATLPTLLLDSFPEKPSFLFCQHWYSYHIIHILLEGISLALKALFLLSDRTRSLVNFRAAAQLMSTAAQLYLEASGCSNSSTSQCRAGGAWRAAFPAAWSTPAHSQLLKQLSSPFPVGFSEGQSPIANNIFGNHHSSLLKSTASFLQAARVLKPNRLT